MTRPRLTPEERQARKLEMMRQRMFGASFRQIARRCGVSKTHAHRLTRNVAIVCSGRRRKPAKPACRVTLVPCADGLGYHLVILRA